MQPPTITGLRIRSVNDAHVVFHAVYLNRLPIVSRRLDTEERRSITSGSVFVWEERGSNTEATGLGIERWTDGIRYGPSRVKEEFLFYHEKDPEPMDFDVGSDSDTTLPSHSGHVFSRPKLIKQTYSAFVETQKGRRKWHLIAYYTQETLEYLRVVDDIPMLHSLHVPPGRYKSARSAKGRGARDPHITGYSPGGAHGGPYAAFPTPPISHPHPPNSSRLGILAPLAYLQNLPPPRRHPFDEELLMSLAMTI